MVGLNAKDINRDVVILFVMCYEYSLSFTNVLKLYKISSKYFWTFMEICGSMLKMGIRKAACIRKTADKIEAYFKDPNKQTEMLTPKEERILEALTWFMEDSFSDGSACLHISQFEQVPFAVGYSDSGSFIASNYNGILKNLDRIGFIQMGDSKFYKTSRFLYYMEKYCGDVDVRELDNMSVTDMLRRISDGEEKLREREQQELYASA